MSPEAIHSLIDMFGVEKGLQILNLFTAMDDTELSQHRVRPRPISGGPQGVAEELALKENQTTDGRPRTTKVKRQASSVESQTTDLRPIA